MSVDLQDLSRRLFKAADQLWTNTTLRPDQYAQPVLALIALRQMEAKFELVDAELLPRLHRPAEADPAPTTRPAARSSSRSIARFSHLLALPEQRQPWPSRAERGDGGHRRDNPDLAGVLPQGYGALPDSVLRELLRLLAPLQIEGDAYGADLRIFHGRVRLRPSCRRAASISRRPRIVKLIVEIIEPYHGAILDPACGSGGMFVHSAEFVRRHHKAPGKEISDLRRREDGGHAAPLPPEPRRPWPLAATSARPTATTTTRTSWSASSIS